MFTECKCNGQQISSIVSKSNDETRQLLKLSRWKFLRDLGFLQLFKCKCNEANVRQSFGFVHGAKFRYNSALWPFRHIKRCNWCFISPYRPSGVRGWPASRNLDSSFSRTAIMYSFLLTFCNPTSVRRNDCGFGMTMKIWIVQTVTATQHKLNPYKFQQRISHLAPIFSLYMCHVFPPWQDKGGGTRRPNTAMATLHLDWKLIAYCSSYSRDVIFAETYLVGDFKSRETLIFF